ncbi:MAG: hypothetical protein A3A83_01415 [Candidatus Doudnabacteria bacterium RIFCSPLOWO2_01_FULL_48_57]|nr:MAG: hypothetical protein A3K05_02690 [Candidatus Doudnabacteria bacterium RIFCSPHIGHO2_01_48_18]OGE97253.1 MAG: hypothetical protein A3A83_01415 [Candidatus Doudnabacteria bacterium RIFCSPLOWO2_01_FULL_48_57]
MFAVLAGSFIAYESYARKHMDLAPKIGGEYVEGLVGQPQRINPLLAPANNVDLDLARIVYSGLLKFDKNLNIAPDLAESLPVVSADGREYTVRLRDNVFWHGKDKQKVTADDVVFTFRTIQNADYQSPLRLSWNRVGVEKIDDRTVRFITRELSATFIANLTVGIMPRYIWEGVPAASFALSKFNLEPVGSGPYQVAEIKRGSSGEIRSLSLERNKKYHLGEPYIDTLTFRFYETTDEIIDAYHSRDISGLGYEPFDRGLFIEAKKKLQQIKLELPQYQAVFINDVKNPAPLGDARVRTALAKSVDKKKIISEVYAGQSSEAYGPILPGHLGYHEQIPGAPMNIYDVEAAKVLLDQAGWIADETGFRKDNQGRYITLSLVTNDFTPNIRAAEMLKQMWESIGVKIILSIQTTIDLEEKYIKPRNYELLLFSENVGADPDPYPFWHSSQRRDPGLNLTTFSNQQVDQLLVEGRSNGDPAARAAKYKQFQEIFVGVVPAIFLSRSQYVYNVTTNTKGINLTTVVTPADRFADVHEWYIETKRIKK